MNRVSKETTKMIAVSALTVGILHFVLTGFGEASSSAWVGICAGWGALTYDIVRTFSRKKNSFGSKG